MKTTRKKGSETMNTPERQYVAIVFHERGSREYTYHNDGPPVAVGDSVRVNTGRGIRPVTVARIVDKAPTGFATKGIEIPTDDSLVGTAEKGGTDA